MFKHKKIVACFLLYINLYFLNAKAQVANYIANGSFEEYYDCNVPHALRKVKSWLSIDSISYGGQHVSTCYNTVPLFGNSYQYPKSGNSYVICTIFNSGQGRGYLKNRLKQNLKLGKTYCVKFYINISDYSTYGIDGFGIFFGDNNIDTITNCNSPLTYIIPQVKNPLGNLISDTLNWVSITGTFVANGSEKYALIGNFILDGALTSTLINSSFLPLVFSDVNFDDVSCMEVDLPAFAGNDTVCVPGTSVYIGRPRDVGIDEACSWYQLPNTNSVIATAAGLWVSPVTTSTYIVRQEICGNIKWDTVVVKEEPLGLKSLNREDGDLTVFPTPANDALHLKLVNASTPFANYTIYDQLGQTIKKGELVFTNQQATIQTSELADGVYVLTLSNHATAPIRKKFVIKSR